MIRECVKFIGISDHAFFFSSNIKRPDQMSSTLFGRGTHTQIGAMHRAETVNRELAEIRDLLQEIKAIPDTVRELKTMVLDMRQRLETLNVPELAPQVKQEQLDDIETKIEALKVLQAPQVTAASLQSLERRLDAKLQALTKKLSDS